MAQIRRVFKKDVIPVLRGMTIYEITRHHSLDVVGRIEERVSLSVAVPLPPVRHNPFLRMKEMPSFLKILRTCQGSQVTQSARRLLWLTGVHTGELREYVMTHYLLLYGRIKGMVYLLSIRHQGRLSFDFQSLWVSGRDANHGLSRIQTTRK